MKHAQKFYKDVEENSAESAFGFFLKETIKNKYREHQEVLSKVSSAFDKEDALIFLKLVPNSPIQLFDAIVKTVSKEFPLEKLDFYDGVHLEISLAEFEHKYKAAMIESQKSFVNNMYDGLKDDSPDEILKVMKELTNRINKSK